MIKSCLVKPLCYFCYMVPFNNLTLLGPNAAKTQNIKSKDINLKTIWHQGRNQGFLDEVTGDVEQVGTSFGGVTC